MHHFAHGLGVPAQCCAQARNIQGGRVVSGAIPQTFGIGAAEPGSPLVDLGTVLGGRVGIGGFAATWAGMRRMARLLPL